MSQISQQQGRRQRRTRGLTFALTAAAGAALAGTLPTGAQAAVIVPAMADAEIRESQPEFTRGAPGSGQVGELQLSQINSNRNLAIMRFSLPAGFTSTDLGDYVSLHAFFRQGTNFGTADGASVRLYALNPTHPLNTSWNEEEVMYRDAGSHQLVNPEIGSGQGFVTPSVIAQPSPGSVTVADPVAPVPAAAGYGANATHARRAPGIRYEDAPFGQQIANENAARLTYNQSQRTAYLADLDDDGIVQGTYGYLPYINQPGYGVRATATQAVGNAISVGDGDPTTTGDGYADIYSDIPETNRPWDSGPTDSYVDDLDGYTLMGYARMTGTSAAGNAISFGDTGSFDNTPEAHELMTRANLVNFLADGLDNGHNTFTFLLGRGLGTLDFDGDTLIDDPVHGGAVHLASKDYIPVDGVVGDYAAVLLIPEPGSLSLAAVAAVGLLRRGSRRRA